RRGDDLVALVHSDDADALGAPPDAADRAGAHPDELPRAGDDGHAIGLPHPQRRDGAAVAGGGPDVGPALAAAGLAAGFAGFGLHAILIDGGALAVAVLGDGEEGLRGVFGH